MHNLPVVDFIYVIPEIFLGLTICFFLTIFSFLSTKELKNFGAPVLIKQTLALSALILICTFFLLYNNPSFSHNLFYGTLSVNYATSVVKGTVVVFSAALFLVIMQSAQKQYLLAFEYVLLILITNLSMFFIVSAHDFIALYLSLEIQALAFYTLAAFKRNSSFSTEAGLKYLVTGSFSSGIFLFGISIIYGFSGTTNYEVLNRLFETFTQNSLGITIGIFFIFAALLFKLAAAPFHQWAPDVYEGAPSTTTAFFSVVPKVVLFFALMQIAFESFNTFSSYWQIFILTSAVLSLFFSNLGAIYQKRIKRFLVFSTMGHVGYMLLSFATNTFFGTQAIFAYILVYIVISMCLWTILLSWTRFTINHVKFLDELKILSKENKFAALTLGCVAFSIAGIPPLLGFYPKIAVFFSLLNTQMFFSAIIIIIASVIGSFYYLRLVKVIFFESKVNNSVVNSENNLTISFTKESSLITSFILFIIIFLFIHPNFFYLITYKIALFFC